MEQLRTERENVKPEFVKFFKQQSHSLEFDVVFIKPKRVQMQHVKFSCQRNMQRQGDQEDNFLEAEETFSKVLKMDEGDDIKELNGTSLKSYFVTDDNTEEVVNIKENQSQTNKNIEGEISDAHKIDLRQFNLGSKFDILSETEIGDNYMRIITR